MESEVLAGGGHPGVAVEGRGRAAPPRSGLGPLRIASRDGRNDPVEAYPAVSRRRLARVHLNRTVQKLGLDQDGNEANGEMRTGDTRQGRYRRPVPWCFRAMRP
jgi:hypothetical protein